MPYFHVVFTLPHEFNPLCRYNPEVLYNLLFRASAATLLEVAADPKTWERRSVSEHPAQLGAKLCSIHMSTARFPPVDFPPITRLDSSPYPFFLPVKVLSRVFRGKFIAGLRRRTGGRNSLSWSHRRTEEPKRFASFLRTVFRQDWVVYAKPAFGGPTQVLRILAVTRIGLPSAITDYWLSTESTSRFAGRITPTARSNAR